MANSDGVIDVHVKFLVFSIAELKSLQMTVQHKLFVKLIREVPSKQLHDVYGMFMNAKEDEFCSLPNVSTHKNEEESRTKS